jgi:chaperonin GroES
MHLEPLSDRIVLKAADPEKITAAGILLPDVKDPERPEQAEVVAAGPEAGPVKVGDLVLFKKYAPDEVKVDGVEYLIVPLGDILAICRP